VNHTVCRRGGQWDRCLARKVKQVQPPTVLIFNSLALSLSFANIFPGFLEFLFHCCLVKQKSWVPCESSPVPSELHSLLGALCSPS